MNLKNLEYLKENLKYLGFDHHLNAELESHIQKQSPDFSIKTEIPHFNKMIEFDLQFKRSETTEMYFLNKYDATLKQDNMPDLQHRFYLNNGNGITAKEAFNLLEGRSVFKELMNKNQEKYQAWLQLDMGNRDENGQFKMKQYHVNYGFNLEEKLSGLPLKELQNQEQKDGLIRSLNKGNIQQATLLEDGKERRIFIEASPQYKNLNIYNDKLKPERLELKEEKKQAKEQKQDLSDAPRQKRTKKHQLT